MKGIYILKYRNWKQYENSIFTYSLLNTFIKQINWYIQIVFLNVCLLITSGIYLIFVNFIKLIHLSIFKYLNIKKLDSGKMEEKSKNIQLKRFKIIIKILLN